MSNATTIDTISGLQMDLARPTVEAIDLHDIAHSLAGIPRWLNHTEVPYSVAQHSVEVCKMLSRRKAAVEVRFAGLLHDAAEAYMGDIVAPLKALLAKQSPVGNRLERLEREILDKVAERFGLARWLFDDPKIKTADVDQREREKRHLIRVPLGANRRDPRDDNDYGDPLIPLDQTSAELLFLRAFHCLDAMRARVASPVKENPKT